MSRQAAWATSTWVDRWSESRWASTIPVHFCNRVKCGAGDWACTDSSDTATPRTLATMSRRAAPGTWMSVAMWSRSRRETAIRVSCSQAARCVAGATGSTARWGLASTEFVGNDEVPSSTDVVQLGGLATSVEAGGDHTCAILEDGRVRCWGYGGSGALGYGNTNTVGDNEHPGDVLALGLSGACAQVTAGHQHTCALFVEGVRCWGDNAYGQLGLPGVTVLGDNEPAGQGGVVSITP